MAIVRVRRWWRLVAELAGLKVDDRRSGTVLRSQASKKRGAGERDRLDVAHRRGAWRKYQDCIEPERPVCHRRDLDPDRHHGQSRQSQSRSRTPTHSYRWRQAVLTAEYSRNLNPIEQIFVKLKHLLREARTRRRNNLRLQLLKILAVFAHDECAKYF